jgi:hypothetical protein
MAAEHNRQDANGNTEYWVGDGWVGERDVCHACMEEREQEGKPYRESETRTSFGLYAGRYCDNCWLTSGYRDATDENAVFSELDAGESLWGDE